MDGEKITGRSYTNTKTLLLLLRAYLYLDDKSFLHFHSPESFSTVSIYLINFKLRVSLMKRRSGFLHTKNELWTHGPSSFNKKTTKMRKLGFQVYGDHYFQIR